MPVFTVVGSFRGHTNPTKLIHFSRSCLLRSRVMTNTCFVLFCSVKQARGFISVTAESSCAMLLFWTENNDGAHRTGRWHGPGDADRADGPPEGGRPPMPRPLQTEPHVSSAHYWSHTQTHVKMQRCVSINTHTSADICPWDLYKLWRLCSIYRRLPRVCSCSSHTGLCSGLGSSSSVTSHTHTQNLLWPLLLCNVAFIGLIKQVFRAWNRTFEQIKLWNHY